jgi:hypothetical protein
MTACVESSQLGDVEVTSYPAPTKQAAGLVNGTITEVSSIYFADKIMITISQGGRLSQWVCLTIRPHNYFLPNSL